MKFLLKSAVALEYFLVMTLRRIAIAVGALDTRPTWRRELFELKIETLFGSELIRYFRHWWTMEIKLNVTHYLVLMMTSIGYVKSSSVYKTGKLLEVWTLELQSWSQFVAIPYGGGQSDERWAMHVLRYFKRHPNRRLQEIHIVYWG